MRDMIAMLDGVDYNVTPSEGGNYSGGSSWASGFPTMPSSSGLAAAQRRYRSGGYLVDTVQTVEPGEGGNYGGGSSWAPGFPTLPSSQGLAAAENARMRGGYLVQRVDTVEPGEGGNYAGGSNWASGFPTMPSASGLAYYANPTRGVVRGGGEVRAREAVTRLIPIADRLLRIYGARCSMASARVLEAFNQAARYRDWRGSLADASLRLQAERNVLRALITGLQSVIVSCSGSTAISRVVERQARQTVALANTMF